MNRTKNIYEAVHHVHKEISKTTYKSNTFSLSLIVFKSFIKNDGEIHYHFILLWLSVIYAGFFGWGGPENVGGSDFSSVEQNFTIGESPKNWGNFSKIGIKININLQNYWENSRKIQIFG